MSPSKVTRKQHGYNYQEYPKIASFEKNMNLELSEFKDQVRGELNEGVHYTVSSVVPSESGTSFIQTGCGPNFSGGIISQCTCRHDIRARWFTSDEWEEKWLAGFTGYSKKKCGASYLFYLIKIQETFCSFKKLFEYYENLDSSLIEVKRTDMNPLGDLYIPNNDQQDRHDESSYLVSHEKHPHKCLRRLQDINFPKYTQTEWTHPTLKHATLLLGDPKLSFVWSKPLIMYKEGIAPRAKRWSNADSFLDNLVPVSNVTLPTFHK